MASQSTERLRPEERVNGHHQTSALLEQLAAIASRPLEEAEAMPGPVYYDAGLYALEMERIFRKEWIYVGRAEEIPEPGDFISIDVGDEPVVIVRGEDREIRALSRVCLHKYADVLGDEESTCGHLERFTCPYHSWVYGLDGKLVGAPFMKKSTLFARERDGYRLPEFRVEVWQGFVFINFDQDATSLSSRLGPVEEVLDGYDFSEWVQFDRIDWGDTPVNWKVVMDNGRECYHHQGTHRKSVEPLYPTRLVETETTDSREWYYQRLMINPKEAAGQEGEHYLAPIMTPEPTPGLSAFQRSHLLLVGIYPTFFMAPGPDMNFVFRFFPTGPESHTLDIGLMVHRSQLDDPRFDEQARAEIREFVTEIQKEDSRQILAVQNMARSATARRGAALSTLERPSWQFQRYLAHRLTGADV